MPMDGHARSQGAANRVPTFTYGFAGGLYDPETGLVCFPRPLLRPQTRTLHFA